MAGSYRELIVKIGADAGGLEKGLSGALSSITGLSTAALSASAVGVAAVAAIGAAAFKVGSDFEAANKTIRAGTGATGEAFEGLKESAKNVFGQVDDSIGEVSKTLADLNTATGATGPTLEKLTEQLLDLTGLGVGFSGEVTNLTRVYGDWGIAIDDAAEANDYLFKVAQSTGAGVDELAGKVVQFGAPFRAMGYDFEEAAALMGKWQKEGVNTENVMAGLNRAAINLGKEGGNVAQGFRETIEAMQATGNATDAAAIALKVFGAEAKTNMTDAVMGGKFSIDELVASLEASEETIGGVAKESETLGEKLGEIGNKAMLYLEPLGTFLVDVLASALDDVIAVADTWAIGLDTMAELADAAGIELWDFSDATKSIGDRLRDFLIGYVTKSMEALTELAKTLNAFPVIGGSFDKTIAIMEKGLARLDGVVESTSGSIGAPTSPKPTSFSGAVGGAKVKVFDLEKALKEAGDEAAEFEKGLEEARKRGVEEFTRAIKNGAIPEIQGLDRVSGETANAMLSDMLAMTRGVDPLVVKLEDIPKRTKDVEAAFATLESQSVADLESLYNSAKQNFDLIQESGEATPRQISEAWRNELEAQKALLAAQGLELSAEEARILADLNAKLEAVTAQMESTWTQFAENVGATVADLGSQLFSDLLEGKFSLSTVTAALKSIKDAFADSLFQPVADQINKFITESIDKLLGKLTGPGGLSGALDKVFGGGGSGPGGSIVGLDAVGGIGGNAGKVASTAASVATSLSNPITAVASVGSLISGVIGNFQTRTTNDRLWDISGHTQVAAIHLGFMLDGMHTYLGSDEWNRHSDMKGHLQSLSDRLTGDIWQTNGRLLDLQGQELPSIRMAVETSTDRVSSDIAKLAAAVEGLMSMQDRPITVTIDGEKVGEATERYTRGRLAY